MLRAMGRHLDQAWKKSEKPGSSTPPWLQDFITPACREAKVLKKPAAAEVNLAVAEADDGADSDFSYGYDEHLQANSSYIVPKVI